MYNDITWHMQCTGLKFNISYQLVLIFFFFFSVSYCMCTVHALFPLLLKHNKHRHCPGNLATCVKQIYCSQKFALTCMYVYHMYIYLNHSHIHVHVRLCVHCFV